MILFAGVFFLQACAARQIIPSRPVQLEPGDALYSSAEKMFQSKSYEKALAIYNEYLSKFPDGHLADTALIKTGAIFTKLGKNENARAKYKQLIAEYPKSPFVADARVETLITFYNEGRYGEVIKHSENTLKYDLTRIHLLRIYALIGDTYMETGFPMDAANHYILAYNKAKEPKKQNVFAKLKKAVELLDMADITSLLSRKKDRLITGYLMYRSGLSKAGEEQYADAVKILAEFVEKFPSHENVNQAKSLIEKLEKKTRYTIGCLLPLSGSSGNIGRKALKGIELALNQFSSQGIQSPVKIIIKDTCSDPEKAVMAVNELFEEQVAAIIGPIFTAETAAFEAQNKRIPIITITQKSNITDIGDYVFRNFFTPKMQVQTITTYAFERLGINKIAILYPDDNYGKTFMNLFWNDVIAYGGKVVGVESYNVDDTDFADPVKKLVGLYYKVPEDLKNAGILIENKDEEGEALEDELKARQDIKENEDEAQKDIEEDEAQNKVEEKPEAIVDFDAIFIPDAPERAGLIIPQLAYYDIKDVYLFGTNLWHSDSLISMAQRYMQNSVMPDVFFDESSSKKVRSFVENFEKTFRGKPGFIEAIAYDTAIILFKLVSQPDIQYRSELKNKLINLRNFQGVTGLTSFDSNGDVRKKLYLLRIKKDKFIELEH
ncbi:MAG: penicillin-binding protein activator [Deltaproteobacteria bacterium]|nr:penicillin-binding protein activator [Deltaproteobacteria bacterium]MBW2661122.1 penicillin-binding protein activator [Deltaproteobacteria bacterium]